MNPTSPFAYRDYRALWVARFASNIAQAAMVVVIGWQVYDIARLTMPAKEAALRLGLVGIVQFLPLAILTLFTGWVADRIDRRWIGRAVLLVEACVAGALALMAYRGTTTLPAIYGVAAVLGMCRAFAQPAIGALAPNLVPPAVLPKAIAASSVAWQIGAITGPALGGYLYAGAHWLPYGVSTALFLLSALAMMAIRPVPRTLLDRSVHPWTQMNDGLRYVARNRLVLGALSLDLFAVLLGGATAMLPIYARDILMVGPAGLGNLRAAPAVGAALTAIWFAVNPLKRDVGVKMMVAVALFGAATIVFGLSRNVALSLLSLAVLGAADMFSVFVRQTLIQLWTPDAMRGRVGAISALFVSGSNELGEARSGLLASLIGPVAAVVLGGFGAIGVTLLWWRLFPELGRARTFDPPATRIITPEQEMAA